MKSAKRISHPAPSNNLEELSVDISPKIPIIALLTYKALYVLIHFSYAYTRKYIEGILISSADSHRLSHVYHLVLLLSLHYALLLIYMCDGDEGK
jgi:hypothetical protein